MSKLPIEDSVKHNGAPDRAAGEAKGRVVVTNESALYERFKWCITSQELELPDFEELDEIDKIARAISETEIGACQFYTTSSL